VRRTRGYRRARTTALILAVDVLSAIRRLSGTIGAFVRRIDMVLKLFA